MEQKRITPLTTAGCFAAVMLILALLSTFMPFFSFVGYFIMPIPMTIIYMKYGMRQALLLGVVVGILMGIFIDPLTAVAQLITFASVGLAIGAGFRYEWAPAKMLACVAAALIAATGVLAAHMPTGFFPAMDGGHRRSSRTYVYCSRHQFAGGDLQRLRYGRRRYDRPV